jgi:hypothetical protein
MKNVESYQDRVEADSGALYAVFWVDSMCVVSIDVENSAELTEKYSGIILGLSRVTNWI